MNRMDKITIIPKVRDYYQRYNKPPKGWMWDGPHYTFRPEEAIDRVKVLKKEGYKAFYVKEKRPPPIVLGGKYDPQYNYRVMRTSYRVKKK